MPPDVASQTLFALWNCPETTPQALCAQIKIAPAQLRAAIEMLRLRKCRIEETPTTLRLASVGLACWQDVLETLAARTGAAIGRRVQVFARTGSTNDIGWRAARQAQNDGLVVLADEQSAGRGRFGHSWSAKPGQSILVSVVLRDFPAGSLDQLTLLAGLQTARGIEAGVLFGTQQSLRVAIKWPNDLLLDGKKVAGVLVERRGSTVVLGIGINVGQRADDFPDAVRGRAISLYQATGGLIDRLRIIAPLIEQLAQLRPLANADSAAWLPEWKSRCEMLGTRITGRHEGAPFSGLVLGIDPLAGLVIRDDAGPTHFLSAATTSLGD